MRIQVWELSIKPGSGDMRLDLRDHGLVVLDETDGGWTDGMYRFTVGIKAGAWSAARILAVREIMEVKYGATVATKPTGFERLRWWYLREVRFHLWPKVERQRNGCTDVSWLWWTWYNEPETGEEIRDPEDDE